MVGTERHIENSEKAVLSLSPARSLFTKSLIIFSFSKSRLTKRALVEGFLLAKLSAVRCHFEVPKTEKTMLNS